METIDSKKSEGTVAGMAEKLVAAGGKAEKAVKEKRERTVKGSHLLEAMMALVKDFRSGEVTLKVEEKTGFHKVTGPSKGKALYISRKGGRVDLNGFTVTHDAVVQITETEAQERHLGKVQAQVDFDKGDEAVLAAFTMALAELSVEVKKDVPAPKEPKADKPPKAPRVPKAPKPDSAPVADGTQVEKPASGVINPDMTAADLDKTE